MGKTHAERRADELKILIETVKIKHHLTEEQLAKKLKVPLSTFGYYKRNIIKFPAGIIWLLETMAEK